MARPERPIDPGAGPVALFAADLRELRRTAGTPSYRTLSRTACFAPSVLSSAASGLAVPSLQVTLAFVRACRGDEAAWRRRWVELTRRTAAQRPAGACTTGTVPAGRSTGPWPTPAQIPAHPDTPVARTAAAHALRRHLERAGPPGCAAILLHGPIGAGKTTFAVQTAHQLRAHWPDGQLYADLSGSSGRPGAAHDVLGWFLRSLGVPAEQVPESCEQRACLYRSLLAERRVLVLLDNARDECQLRPLLASADGSHVLVTARSRMAGLASAHRLEVPPLAPADAVAMLRAMVGQDRVDAAPQCARRIAELCDHLPLALWVVGTRLAGRPDWTLCAVAERLQRTTGRLRWLWAGDVDVRSRIQDAYDRLSPAARHLFHVLAHAPEATIMADQVRAVDRCGDAEDLVEVLTDHGLVHRRADGLRLPGLFRLFAREVTPVPAPSLAGLAAGG